MYAPDNAERTRMTITPIYCLLLSHITKRV